MSDIFSKKLVFLISGILILAVDQITKFLVALYVPENVPAVWKFAGDFFWLVHHRNPGIAFSLGNGFPDWLRVLLFVALTAVVLIVLAVYLVREKSLTTLPRWGLWTILAGGLGNLMDRIFRPDGVVDFLSFDFYFHHLWGWSRFPTFNVADMAVTCGGVLIAISFLFGEKKKTEEAA